MKYQAGSLVTARNRDWVVLPSEDDKLVLLKPLGGSEDEITGIYLPLGFALDKIESADFPLPGANDLGDIASARVLYNAARLSFRNGAGPFRSLAKLSFRPRPYQMVPLIMALKQPGPVRLLIADDVGVGKTVEALIILKELLERRQIKRFAVIVLPHLCEQWQTELKAKFSIDAVIIRSNTQARLDREIPGDESVFHHYPYQVISIDYIKSDQRRQVFIQECPELVIVDEAHTCSAAIGVKTVRQQRYQLIKDIAKKPDQNMIYLTATPHSGKQGQFSALLGLIKPDYQLLDLSKADRNQRRDLAKYYVQRRRADVEKWMNKDTPFPKRDAGEFQYDLSTRYSAFYDDMLDFALGLTRSGDLHQGRRRLRYWSALALLRGVMSSPAAGIDMLKNRIKKQTACGDTDDDLETLANPMMDGDYDSARDYTPTGIINKTDWSGSENKKLNLLADQLGRLRGVKHDFKAARALEIIKKWLKQGFNPVVFCRFIRTANYLGELFKGAMKTVNIQAVTSEDPDEVRKARIDDMRASAKKVLIATDCLSEGINLQDQFTAVLHYDLPWNPNRLEQREGRIDRYGQIAETVKAYLLYGADNPIDGVVLKVLLRKVREIRRSTGISIPFPEDSQSLMDTVLQAVISNSQAATQRRNAKQLTFDFSQADEVKQKELIATKAIEKAADREHAVRSVFAQHAIKAYQIEQDLKQSDEAIGNPEAVESFVTLALRNILGVQITQDKKKKGYTLYTANLPPVLQSAITPLKQLKVSFFSPCAEGYIYLGRNHLFVEQLCQYLMADSLNRPTQDGPARAAVIKCRDVAVKTVLLMFRVRNVIEEKRVRNQFVAEEMLLWGYAGSPQDNNFLDQDQVKLLMSHVAPSANLTDPAKAAFLENELENIAELRQEFDKIALQRAEILIQAHERFRKVMGGKRYKAVEPVLPMDLMGVYILLPDRTNA
ncbi:helicase-related protein [Desulfococcaceae bacterium HSG9]|nr:helicase-related protein [Desulfococcaceae bacterium HSG9]